jgi:hypothetical protein
MRVNPSFPEIVETCQKNTRPTGHGMAVAAKATDAVLRVVNTQPPLFLPKPIDKRLYERR